MLAVGVRERGLGSWLMMEPLLAFSLAIGVQSAGRGAAAAAVTDAVGSDKVTRGRALNVER